MGANERASGPCGDGPAESVEVEVEGIEAGGVDARDIEVRGIEKLRVARYEFVIEAVDNLSLPPYKGSTFRGGFGTAFRNIACSTRRADCRDCMLKRACPYAYVFETAPPDGSEALTKFEHVPHPSMRSTFPEPRGWGKGGPMCGIRLGKYSHTPPGQQSTICWQHRTRLRNPCVRGSLY
ncbi:MAG: hypothetical protein QME92_05725 [Bacillota bacterium]|nr:hypothetical protein [Bacillota bacterium]